MSIGTWSKDGAFGGVYSVRLWSELKPEVILATIIDPERCNYKWAGIALLTSPTGSEIISVSCKVGSHNQK